MAILQGSSAGDVPILADGSLCLWQAQPRPSTMAGKLAKRILPI